MRQFLITVATQVLATLIVLIIVDKYFNQSRKFVESLVGR